MRVSFNLLEEPWIPVVDSAGRYLRIGIRDALLRALEWRRIEHPSPLAEVALHRVLLAVLHRALGHEHPTEADEAADLWAREQFPREPIEGYLDRLRHRFDLYHPEAPFYQIADLPDENPLPWTKLLPERASGHNPTLFDHSLDEHPEPAEPWEAATALLVHQMFVPGGLLRRFDVTSAKGAPLAMAATFLARANTLFHTLLLNLPPYRADEADDTPVWEDFIRFRDLRGYTRQVPMRGRTRVYTWLSRSIRLLREPDGRVLWIAYGPGFQPEEQTFEPDPMCAYARREKGLEVVRLKKDRALWRDSESLVPRGNGGLPPQVLEWARTVLRAVGSPALVVPVAVAGQITDRAKMAKIEDVRRETYPLPLSLSLEQAAEIRWAVESAEKTGRGLQTAAREIAQQLASSPEDAGRVARSLPLLREYWAHLDTEFAGFLSELAHGRDARAHWKESLHRAVTAAWDTTRIAVGAAARHLKALVQAGRTKDRLLGELI